MKIIKGLVFNEAGEFSKGDIATSSDSITDVIFDSAECNRNTQTIKDESIIDASGLYVIPGLIDIHLHGSIGHDFCSCDESGIKQIVDYELRNGITSICPTTMTLAEDDLVRIVRTISRAKLEGLEEIVGINMEGPFISHKKRAAQDESFIKNPDLDMFDRIYEASGGLIRLCDIAPELEGSMEFIKSIKSKVHVSLAHTACDYDTALEAFNSGADHVTHMFNAMNVLHHRDTGVLGAASDSDGIFVELIGDGIHVSAPAVRLLYKILGTDRVVLVSDSMEATGMSDGEYSLGGQSVIKKGKVAVIEGTDTLAGSVNNLLDILRIVIKKMNIPIEDAIKSVTFNPARSIGIYHERGSVSVGKKADIVMINKDIELVHVIKGGELIF